MNIDDYMDMLAYEAEQEVDSFEAEIDFLYKVIDLACKELGVAYGDEGKDKEYWMLFLWLKAREE